MLMKKAKLFISALLVACTALLASAQDIKVSGVVTDAGSGEPVGGAAVQLKGVSTRYAITDMAGNYSLSVPSNGVLEVSLLGYTTASIHVNGRNRIDIALNTDTQMIDETVVVGYGSAKKISAITGSAATVGAKILQNAPMVSAADALQGQVSGLQVWMSSGEPSATVSMRIRGVNSINAGNTPLYILDGATVGASVFNTISANDIENITVMKDASATAIYGSRAANGVVFITTKKGSRSEKPVITVRGQYGFSKMINMNSETMSSEQWFQFNEMMDPKFLENPTNAARKEFALSHNINTDWVDFFFKDKAPTWQAEVTFSGATEKVDYYTSVGALNQEGNAPYSFMDRYTILSKLNAQLAKWLKMGYSLNLSYQKIDTTGFASSGNSIYNPMFEALRLPKWIIPYEYTEDEHGNLVYGDEKEWFDEKGMYNTKYLQKIQPSNRDYIRFNGNIYEQITPIKGLTIKAVQAMSAYDYRSTGKANPVGPFEGDGTASESFSRDYQLTATNTAEYTIDFGREKNHNITALIGQEAIIEKSNSFGASIGGIVDIRQGEVNQGTILKKPSWSMSDLATNSYFARVSYNYADKYLVDASFRRDGSSLFGANKRYGNFWSVGTRWNMNKENWLKDVSWLNTLAVKVSYGTTGNSSISNYLPYGTVASGGQYDGNKSWTISNPENKDLTWEVVENFNAGVSARLWNILSVDVDYYNKMTKNMLMEIPYSLTTGHSGGWGNVANMRNRGIDLDLSVDVPMPKDFYLNISANLNYNKNEITKLFDGRDEFEVSGTGIKYKVGKPYGEFYWPRSAGVDPRDGMQMWYDTEGNKTKNFSDDYAVFTGKQRYAPLAGGFNLTFAWKGLSLGAQFSWVGKKYTINNDRYFLTNPSFLKSDNGLASMLNMWTTPGQITDVPCLESVREFDDTLLENSSFLRLKNLQVAYSLPKSIIKRSGFIEGFRVFFVGRNLLTATSYTGFDPEADSNLQLGRYPNSKQYTFGVEFTF